jgi:hypothetical protein
MQYHGAEDYLDRTVEPQYQLQKNHSALSGQQTSQRPIKQFEA